MAVTISYSGNLEAPRTGALSLAFSALKDEETQLTKRVAELQARLSAVRQAISAMKPLLPQQEQEKADLEEEDEDGDDAQNSAGPFAGLKFAQALKVYLDAQTAPLTTTEIARGFEDAGWKFRSQTQSGKVNQVGVTLRRFKDKLFEVNNEGRWSTIDL